MNDIVVTDWFVALAEECKALVSEVEFGARWALIEGYHKLGETISTNPHFKRYSKDNRKALQELAESANLSESTVYRAVQFYNKFPDLSLLPDGKDLSWSRVVSKYLPDAAGKRNSEELQVLQQVKRLLTMSLDEVPDELREDIKMWRTQGKELAKRLL